MKSSEPPRLKRTLARTMTNPTTAPAVQRDAIGQTDRLHHQALESAFLQLSFAMKIWHFVRSGGLQRESFDIALTALDGRNVPYVMHAGEFRLGSSRFRRSG